MGTVTIHVKDVMGPVAIAVLEDSSFLDIVAAMERYAVGAVTVIDAERRPVGVVSEDDLLLKETDTVRHSVSMFESRTRRQEHQKAAGVKAAELMTTPVITVTPDTSVRDAARLMHDKRIKQVPVVDPATGCICGTLHQRDALRVFVRPAADVLADIAALLPDREAFSVEVERAVVTIGGKVRRKSQTVALVARIREVEGVVDVVSELTYDTEDFIVTPPLL
ncbi:CBS domain-containing protein [Nonomuraea sp. NEAU-A123]|uniref:CBS domain-containing protein n=1 Tax=Nonomuraea sp. NEAU-A123 TaxID=2839649 RepID=UPI0027E06C2E|nr:CBS domain-containing protein [Nonomuraea sp. NEAU-A123]